MRGHKKDILATAARNFKCGASFVSTDGHDFLSGRDWQMRKRECFERDGYMCRASGHYRISIKDEAFSYLCGAPADHPHHVIPKGKGGSDDLSNLMSICANHHRIAHPEKAVRWSKSQSA